MSTELDPRYGEAIKPLAEFCALHGYRWRWKISNPGQWHAVVQIIDPRQEGHTKVLAWYSSTCVDEMTAMKSAVRYAIEGAQKKPDVEERLRAARGKRRI